MKAPILVQPFKSWIDSHDPKTLSLLLGVELRTVYRWKNAEALPYPKTMKRIVELAKGKVDYRHIITFYLDNQKH